MLGYLITWTTYGSWLQGDGRRYVKNSKILQENSALRKDNFMRLKNKPVKLSSQQQIIVCQAILNKAKTLNQRIFSLAICSDHVHIVAEPISEKIEKVVSYHKNAARLALRQNGFTDRLWTRGFDKRFCYSKEQLNSRIKYVNRHMKSPV